MKIHLFIAGGVILLGIYLNFNRMEMMIACLTITFIIVAEMFNTSIEYVLNRIIRGHDEIVKIIKNISAGAVLVAALNAIIVGYFLFFKREPFSDFEAGIIKISQSSWHVTFLILVAIVLGVILAKVIFQKGTPMRGGMPSGHAAVSFGIATIVALISCNALVAILVYILAFLVSQGRLSKELHTFWEVLAGAVFGIFCSLLLYQLMTSLISSR